MLVRPSVLALLAALAVSIPFDATASTSAYTQQAPKLAGTGASGAAR